MSKSPFAIIAGIGPATGRSCALRFAKTYPVVLISRRPESYDDIVSEINQAGGQAMGISADVANPASVRSAFVAIRKKMAGAKLATAIFNAADGLSILPFLETKVEDLDASLNVNAYVSDLP
jgi:NAD(P)-dependent dehydrogenase (short-subunit alcohol dehydrogenase family)